jgi:catechol 2,3-dioxygenase
VAMHIGHAALQVPDPEGYSGLMQRALGLRETAREHGAIMLSSNEKHHELQILPGDAAGLDHIGLELDTEDELQAVVERLEASDAERVQDPPVESGLSSAARFVGPGSMVFELYVNMDREPFSLGGVLQSGIRKLGHLTLFSDEAEPIRSFWEDTLGFRVSDSVDGITWMRCDTDHHGLTVGPGESGTVLHHLAWEVQDLASLGKYCDHLAEERLALNWGPVRHGPGFNVAAYMPDDYGLITEVYADLLQIRNDATYQPVDWSTHPSPINVWGPPPGADFLTLGIPVLGPARPAIAPKATAS